VHREGITILQFVRSRYKKDFNQSTRVIFANPFFIFSSVRSTTLTNMAIH